MPRYTLYPTTGDELAFQLNVAECWTGTLTVTVADADLVVSATLVAVTLYVPAAEGAVYRPLVEMVPAVAVQVTAVLLLPVTVAVNCCVALVESEAEPGESDTATTAALTVTVADADLVVSATLVAFTVKDPAALGAVYMPLEETLPPVADHVTAVLLLPLMLAVNCCVPPVSIEAEIGETVTETTGALTVTVADADLVVSATLVAFTVKDPAVLGAVYKPDDETEPPVADQVTAVLLDPVTLAVNCCVPLVAIEAEPGAMETATVCGALTVTVADADFVVSAALIAVTVNVPAVPGAVYKPAAEIEPPVADQVTAVLVLPLTVAANCCDPPVVRDTEPGETLTATATVASTVTAADADLVVSAVLVAVTTKLPGVMGATYIPLEEMLPPLAFQETPVLLVPLTLAANCWLFPTGSDVDAGATATVTETGDAEPDP